MPPERFAGTRPRAWSATSDREDLLFFCRQHVIDFGDSGIGRLLNVARKAIVVVLADLVIFLEFFDPVHRIAPHMTHRDTRGFRILVRDLDQFLAPILVELWNPQANGLSLGCRR